MRSRNRRIRATAVVALLATLAFALGGCGAMNPRLANPNYEASDGVALDMSGQVTGENLMIVSSGAHQPGRLLGALTNRGDSTMTVTIALVGATTPAARQSVNPGQTVLLGEAGNDVEFPSLPAAPGATQLVTFESPQLGSQQVPLPVLNGTFAEYASLVPTPSSPAG